MVSVSGAASASITRGAPIAIGEQPASASRGTRASAHSDAGSQYRAFPGYLLATNHWKLTTEHELRQAIRRPQGDRREPGRRRPLLRHAARAVRRERHQGRAARRRRLGAQSRRGVRRSVRLLAARQLRQARHRAGPEAGRRPRDPVAPDRGRRRVPAGLPTRRDRTPRASATTRCPSANRASSTCRCPASARWARLPNVRRWTRSCRPIPASPSRTRARTASRTARRSSPST